MWKTTIWIIAINFVFNLYTTEADSSDEHIHIKIHVPELFRKHTHVKKVQKHFYHPKKIIKYPESYFDNELETSYSAPYYQQQYPTKHSFNHLNNYHSLLESYPDIEMLDLPHYQRPRKMPNMLAEFHHLNSNLYPKLGKKKKFRGMKKPQIYEESYEDDDGYNDDFEAKMAVESTQNNQYSAENFNYHDSIQSLPINTYQNSPWITPTEFLEPLKLRNEYNWETSVIDEYPNIWQNDDNYHQPTAQILESGKSKLFSLTNGGRLPKRDNFEQYDNNWQVKQQPKKKRNKRKRYLKPLSDF